MTITPRMANALNPNHSLVTPRVSNGLHVNHSVATPQNPRVESAR
jgi:hypothetical protein